MNTKKFFSIGILLTIFLVSCGVVETLPIKPPTPTLRPTWTPTPPPVNLIGYNYTLTDVGDGWNEGIVHIAFENATDNYISGKYFDFTGAILETLEGKTYPVQLFFQTGNFAYGFGREISDYQVDFSYLPQIIPPHFRWDSDQPWFGDPYLFFKFRVAIAAKPISILIPSHPNFNINLDTASQPSISFPAEEAILSAYTLPLSALAGRVISDQPEGLLVTLNGTGWGGVPTACLGVTIVNRDNFYAKSASFHNPVIAFYYSNGGITNYYSDISYEVGPGQTKQDCVPLDHVFLASCDPEFRFLFYENGKREIYKLSVCE